MERDDERVRRIPPCEACGRRRCVCDRAADAWAAARGVKLPSEADTGRLLGQTTLSNEQLRDLEERREQADDMRAYLELVEERIEALDRQEKLVRQERERLGVDAEVLRLRFEGEGKTSAEIARQLGRKTHSWASRRLTTIRAEARQGLATAGVAAPTCARPGCNKPVPPSKRPGRPRRFCSRRCANAYHQNLRRERRRARRRRRAQSGRSVSANVSDMRQAPTGSVTPSDSPHASAQNSAEPTVSESE